MTILVSFGLQALVLAILVIIPLIYYQVLPSTAMSAFLTAPPPPPPAPPPPKAMPKVQVHKIVSQFKNNQLQAPHQIPKKIEIVKESAVPPPSNGVVGGVEGGVGGSGGVLGGVLGGIPSAAPPPPPPPKAATPSIIHVGGQVQAANCVRCPSPQYPPLARQARIQGTVRLHAIIAKDGSIKNLQVISGHPMLVGSAMQAVRQWRYAPTLLNGTPVEVDTEITVNFTLAG